jgi:hypothetical protein
MTLKKQRGKSGDGHEYTWFKWDEDEAGIRWGKNAKNPEKIERLELMIEVGALSLVWDMLSRPKIMQLNTLSDAEERYIVRKSLRKAAEAGWISHDLFEVLLKLIGGCDRLKTQNKVDHAAIRAAIRANPNLTLGQISRMGNCSRDTASRIKRDALSDD